MTSLGTTSDCGAMLGATERGPLTLAEILAFRERLALDAPETQDAARIDRLRALEELRCTTEAAQAETTADFTVSMRAAATERGVPSTRRDRGLGSQVGLARRESPHRGAQHLALSMVLRTELPCTRAAFRAGRIDEWRATLIARETACLTAEHRAAVDEAVAGDLATVEAYSIGQLTGHVHRLAAELDPAAVADRRRRAEQDRHTSTRPAPDTMCWFRALLSVRDGVAVQATLDREARRLEAAGDPRGLGQIRADLLVTWVLSGGVGTMTCRTTTSRTPATWTPSSWAPAPDAPAPTAPMASSGVPVMVDLLVSDTVLLGDEDGVGWVDGYGPVPGDLIRDWIATRLDDRDAADVTAWVRRVYRQPGSGHLVSMDTRAQRFDGRLANFLRLRDQRCRTPWCDAPIRHLDHVVARAEGGPTTADNGQGLCAHCNHAKQADGWRARPRPGPRRTVETVTPTGHAYRSTAPAPPGPTPPPSPGYRAGPLLAA